MAEGTAPEIVDPNTAATTAAVEMDVENVETAADGGESIQKRARKEDEPLEENDDVVSKKQKVDEEKSVEEQRLEKLEGQEEEKEAEEGEEEKEASGPVNLGPKSFGSALEIFNYFFKFLHAWPSYLNVNKYEHMMLLELLKNGHAEPDKKIGRGVRAFQIRNHPTFKSKCFFLIREDDSVDDFSFRKCVDHILPLPEDMHLKSDVKGFNGGGGGKHHGGKGGRGRGGRGGGRGHGKGGRWRH